MFSLGSLSSRLVREWNLARQIAFNVCICYRDIKDSSGRRWFLSQLEQKKSDRIYLEEKNLVTRACSLAVLLIGREKHSSNLGG